MDEALDCGQDDYFSPLKVFEYMAAALPVVASAVGQIPSIIQDGRTGILVPQAVGEKIRRHPDSGIRGKRFGEGWVDGIFGEDHRHA